MYLIDIWGFEIMESTIVNNTEKSKFLGWGLYMPKRMRLIIHKFNEHELCCKNDDNK